MVTFSSNVRERLERRRYVFLLISYILVLWGPLVFQSLSFSEHISDGTLLLLVIAIFNFIRGNSFYRRISFGVFFFLAFGKSLSLGLDIEKFIILSWSVMLVYFGFFLTILLRSVWEAQKVNMNTILGAIAGYIQIGVIAFILFKICDLLYNGAAFNRIVQISDIIYFSFVTLTTVGFGDITPVTDETKAFTVIFAMIGQFYMAILMAVLVGKYQQEHRK